MLKEIYCIGKSSGLEHELPGEYEMHEKANSLFGALFVENPPEYDRALKSKEFENFLNDALFGYHNADLFYDGDIFHEGCVSVDWGKRKVTVLDPKQYAALRFEFRFGKFKKWAEGLTFDQFIDPAGHNRALLANDLGYNNYKEIGIYDVDADRLYGVDNWCREIGAAEKGFTFFLHASYGYFVI